MKGKQKETPMWAGIWDKDSVNFGIQLEAFSGQHHTFYYIWGRISIFIVIVTLFWVDYNNIWTG